MFEKFTERGRKVIIYAREEPEKRQNDYLGTEHLLLAILREDDSLPVAILRKMGLSIEDLQMEIERNLPSGTNILTFGDIPFTPRAKKVLELAVEEARLLGHNYIGSEHLLLGLIREEEGIAGKILRAFGAYLLVRGGIERRYGLPGRKAHDDLLYVADGAVAAVSHLGADQSGGSGDQPESGHIGWVGGWRDRHPNLWLCCEAWGDNTSEHPAGQER